MSIHRQSSYIFSKLLKRLTATSDRKGSMLIYIIVMIAFFGIIGTALVSMFSASAISSYTPNYANRSLYMAESAMRYALSELRNGDFESVIGTLNITATYTLTGGQSFNINVFGKWFESSADQDLIINDTLSLTVPQGTIPSGFSVPDGAYVVNVESLRDSMVFSGTPGKFSAQVAAYLKSEDNDISFSLVVNDDFETKQDEAIHLAVLPVSTEFPSGLPDTITEGNSLYVTSTATNAFPPKHGSIYVLADTTGVKTEYYYETVENHGTYAELTNISSDLYLEAGDYIILSENNHHLVTTGSVASMSSVYGGTANMDFPLDITLPIETPEAEEQQSDLPEDELVTEVATPVETASGAVEVDTVTGEITLGGDVGSAYGAVWFGGDAEFGGLSDFCAGGECQFHYGVRVFFLFKYEGAGDGFTFAFVNGDNNSTNSTGGSGGQGALLAYGGPGNDDGLQPPKMAVEFDTYTNAGRNDPLASDKEALQYVFWGNDDADLFDDNRHYDFLLWSFTTPTHDVKTTPAVSSDGSVVYFGSKDPDPNTGYLYAVNTANGSEKWATPFSTGGDVESSPALSSDGSVVYVGSNDGNLYAVNTTTEAQIWAFPTGDKVRSSPVLSPNGSVVYVGSDDFNLYAVNTNTGLAEWAAPFSTGDKVKSSPVLSPDGSVVYVGSDDFNLYAVNTNTGLAEWAAPFSTGDKVGSSPVLSPDGSVVYVGSDDFNLYAVNTNTGLAEWAAPFSTGDKVKSSPVLSPDGSVVYVGSDDFNLYAVNTNTGLAEWAAPFSTGDKVESSPALSSDGSVVYVGSKSDYLYALYTSDGSLKWKYDIEFDVNSSPAISNDGTRLYVGSNDDSLHAFEISDNPANIKDKYITYEDLMSDITVSSTTNWLNSDSSDWNVKKPWAVRIEIERSTTDSGRGKYVLKTWIRQCTETDGSDIRDTYFSDTRVEYQAKPPHMEQTIELSADDHTKFETFLFGMTEATGGAVQTAVISNVQLGFIRPGDTIIDTDTSWP